MQNKTLLAEVRASTVEVVVMDGDIYFATIELLGNERQRCEKYQA
jgi:hypothetical protein